MIALIALAGLLDALRQADARVAAVAWRLQTANVAICRDVVPLAGLSIETLDQYRPTERAEARAGLGLGDLPQISVVVPGSAAARAGLQVGDELVAIDDVPAPPARAGQASYERTAMIETALAAALARPPARLTLARRTVSLSGDPGCESTVQLVPENRFDASAGS